MTAQYDFISATTLTSNASTITLSSLGSYRNYRIVVTSVDNAGSDYLAVGVNNDFNTSINRSRAIFSTGGSGAVTGNNHDYMRGGINSGTAYNDTWATNIVDVQQPSSGGTQSTTLGFGGIATNMVIMAAGFYDNSNTITSIVLRVGTGAGGTQFTTGTVAVIYGRNV